MIIKSMSRTGGILQALEYINQPQKVGNNQLYWNLQTEKNNIKEIEKEFLNNSFYAKSRKNGILIYHDVISLSDKEILPKKQLEEILLDLAEKYLERRALNALAYAVPHFDSHNPHIHLIISANEQESEKKIRISKFKFQKIKQEIEKYQQMKYPELEHSKINHTPDPEVKEKIKETREERERSRRFKKTNQPTPPTQKENLQEIITKSLFKATSEAHLIKILNEARVRYIPTEEKTSPRAL